MCTYTLTNKGRPHEPIFHASLVLTDIGPVHSDCPNTSMMWMLREAKYSKVWVVVEQHKRKKAFEIKKNEAKKIPGMYRYIAEKNQMKILVCK